MNNSTNNTSNAQFSEPPPLNHENPTNWVTIPSRPDDDPIPQYSPTIMGSTTEYNPAGNCGGNFTAAKFQKNNSAYNYATNIATNSFAQPGRLSGALQTQDPTGEHSIERAVMDGLQYIGDKHLENDDLLQFVSDSKFSGHCVALLASALIPSSYHTSNIHWLRCDNLPKRRWSHKFGRDQVTNRDFAGNKIRNPASSHWEINLGPDLFLEQDANIIATYGIVAYLFVPANQVNII